MSGYIVTGLLILAAVGLGRQAQVTTRRLHAYRAYVARKRAQRDRIPEDVCWTFLRGVSAEYARDLRVARLRGDLEPSRHLSVVRDGEAA